MARVTVEDCLPMVDNRFALVLLAAKRARQLNRGAAARVETRHKKPTSTSMEEIAGSKVEYRVKEVDEAAKA